MRGQRGTEWKCNDDWWIIECLTVWKELQRTWAFVDINLCKATRDSPKLWEQWHQKSLSMSRTHEKSEIKKYSSKFACKFAVESEPQDIIATPLRIRDFHIQVRKWEFGEGAKGLPLFSDSGARTEDLPSSPPTSDVVSSQISLIHQSFKLMPHTLQVQVNLRTCRWISNFSCRVPLPGSVSRSPNSKLIVRSGISRSLPDGVPSSTM